MKKFLITMLVLLIVGGLVFGLFYFFWTAENFASLGASAMKDGKYGRAVSRYEMAVRLDPDNPEYVLSLADACIANGSYTKAERSLVDAIKARPSAVLYTKLSSVYVEQDKLFDAQKMLDSITAPNLRAEIDGKRPAAPVFLPESGEYDEYIDLTIECAGSTYISLTEQYPSTSSGAYEAPIALSAGATHVSAITVGEDGLVSPLSQGDYTIVGVVEEVAFASPELEAYVRDTLFIPRTSKVMTDDLWQITELTLPDDVSVYDDLVNFTKLKTLVIHDSPLDSCGFLAAMPELTTLDLSGCMLSPEDIEMIGALPLLCNLRLSGCGLTNISSLSALVDLEDLDLSYNSISDINALNGMKYLRQLNLRSNAVASLESLKYAGKLRVLDISENDIPSLAPLSNCSQMEKLIADDNDISDIGIVAKMPELSSLCASRNKIFDASAVASCPALTRLELADNALTSIAMLADMPQLSYLDVSHNLITEIPALNVEECKLSSFYASYNKLESVQHLAGLLELTYVNVDYNDNLEDIECLTPCHMLVQVDAFGTKVEKVEALLSMGVIVNFDPTTAPSYVDN
ncbi:MAG: leucine-rich repeat domain-containing protein [Oscillospiraceae bacterium]|nr:leucine-rich repeat domain-containing protein [Oscillospiraceae bacterium]